MTTRYTNSAGCKRQTLNNSQRKQPSKGTDLATMDRIQKTQAETRAIVATGKCPTCGASIRRNLSLAGWYQCEQLGAEGFRKDSTKPSCSWQGFTE